MKKIVSLLAVLVLVVSGCSNGEKPTITIGMMSGSSQLPIVYAKETGMFDKLPYNVDYKIFNSAKDRDAAFYAGDIDAVQTDLSGEMIYLKDGIDLSIYGGENSIFRLITKPGFTETAGTKYKVGISDNTVIEYYATLASEKLGMDFDMVGIPSMPEREAALESGDIDMAIMPEPFATKAINAGGTELLSSLTDGTPQLGAMGVLNSSITDKNFDPNKFNEIVDEAADKLNTMDPSEYKDIAVNSGLMEADTYDTTIQKSFPHANQISSDLWANVNQWAISQEMATDTYDYATYYNGK